jgi:uncharacterized delta-60 repeat protein
LALRGDEDIVLAADGGDVIVLTSAGDLETTFNPGADHGIVTTSGLAWSAVALQGDAILLGGQRSAGTAAVARLTAAGALDPTFAVGGATTGVLDVADADIDNDSSEVLGVAVGADGSVLATGEQTAGAAQRLLVARFTADGAAPASGLIGAKALSDGAADKATGRTVFGRPGGGVAVTGDVIVSDGGAVTHHELLALRTTPAGEPDSAYSTDDLRPGFVRINFPGGGADVRGGAGLRRSDDRLVLAGASASNTRVGLVRLNGDRPLLAVEPQGGGAGLDFGGQTTGSQAAARTVTVRNVGEADAVLGTVAVTGSQAGAFPLSADTCSGTLLAPGATCSFAIAFAPSSSVAFAAVVDVPSDADGAPAHVPLTGTGVPVPESTEPGRVATASFGVDGVALHTFTEPGWFTPIVALPGGGSIVGFTGPVDSGVARLTPTGQLDASFGAGGKRTFTDGFMRDVARDSQGRIVAVADTLDLKMLVARVTPEGQLDATFAAASGHPGYLTIGLPATQRVDATAVAVRADDGVVVAGLTGGNPGGGKGVVAELTPTGELDASWGAAGATPGIVTTDVGGIAAWNDVALQDGHVVVGGKVMPPASDSVGAIARFTAAGALDPTFAPGGDLTGIRKVRTAAPGATGSQVTALAIAHDGHVLATGWQQEGADKKLLLGRYSADGGVEAGQDWTGPSTLQLGGATTVTGDSIVALSHGKALLAGTNNASGNAHLITIRIANDGFPDADWGDQVTHPGVMEVPVGEGDDYNPSAALRPDGRMLVATAQTTGPSTFGVVLFTGDRPQLTATVAGGSLAFGEQTTGAGSPPRTVTLENNGDADVTVTAMTAPGSFTVTDAGGCAGKSLPPFGTCAFTIAFAPTAAGDVDGALTITSNAAGSPIAVPVSGHGVAPVVIPPPNTNVTPPEAPPDLPVSAGVTDTPAQPGDTAVVTADVDHPAGTKIVAYRWSLVGPDPKTITIDTGPSPKLLQRPGPGITRVWVWAVDDRGKMSDEPAVVELDPPDAQCDPGATTGNIRINELHIKSSQCIKKGKAGDSDFIVPLEGGGASVNGLELQCPKTGACPTLRIRSTDGKGALTNNDKTRPIAVTSTGPVALRWPNGQHGSLDLGEQSLSFTLRNPTGFGPRTARIARDLNQGRTTGVPDTAPPIDAPRVEQVLLRLKSLPAGTTFGGLPARGEYTVSAFETKGEPGAKLSGQVAVKTPDGGEATGPVAQEADAEGGAHTDGQKWEVDLSGQYIPPLLHFEELKLFYTPFAEGEDGEPDRTGVFEFKAVVGLDITGWTVAAEGVFSQTNGFEKIAFGFERNGSKGVTGLNLPTGRAGKANLSSMETPIQLDALEGEFQRKPYVKVGGTVKVLLMDEFVWGGSLAYSAPHGEEPWSLLVSATGSPISGLAVTGTVFVTGNPDPPPLVGGLGLKGSVRYSVKEILTLDGFVYAYLGSDPHTHKVNGELGVGGSVKFLSFDLASAQGLVNGNYLAGCGKLGVPGYQIKGWGVFKFASQTGDGGFGDCDKIAKYSLVPELAGLARRRGHAAAAERQLRVPAGVSMANLEVRTADGLARVKVDGPGGLSFVSPDQPGVQAGDGGKAFAMADAATHRTVIGIPKPPAGTYRVSAVEGAPALVDARVSYGRPTTVAATVAGGGSRHTLRYRVDAPAGATVAFDERAGSVASPIGKANGASGGIVFRSAPLGQPKREIVARITTADGVELPPRVVARYVAVVPRPARTKGLNVTFDAARATATVRWAHTDDAAQYDLLLRTSTGRRLATRQSGRTLLIKNIYAGDRLTLTVRGVSTAHLIGPPATLRAKAPAVKHRRR